MKLLLIGKDAPAVSWVEPRLQAAGFRVSLSTSYDMVFQTEEAQSAAAILIDLGHDGPQGGQVVSYARAQGIVHPIILMSARSDWREKVASFEAGADDFIVKPMRSEEIIARLQKSIRRAMGLPNNRFRVGTFELDLHKRCAWRNGLCLELTRNEFSVLRLLLQEPGQVVATDEIRAAISPTAPITLNAVEVLVARLRKKIGAELIRTIRKLGYRFVMEDGQPCEAEPCKMANTEPSSASPGNLIVARPSRTDCSACKHDFVPASEA